MLCWEFSGFIRKDKFYFTLKKSSNKKPANPTHYDSRLSPLLTFGASEYSKNSISTCSMNHHVVRSQRTFPMRLCLFCRLSRKKHPSGSQGKFFSSEKIFIQSSSVFRSRKLILTNCSARQFSVTIHLIFSCSFRQTVV